MRRVAPHLTATAMFAWTAIACDPGGWRIVESGTTKTLRSVFVESADRIYMTGEDGVVLIWDGGDNVVDTSTDAYEAAFPPTFYGIVASGDELAIAGDGGDVYTRRGTAWTKDESRSNQRMLTMLRPAPSVFYAAGEGGRVIRREVGADSWAGVPVNPPRDAKITGGWGINRETIVLATDRGVLLEQIDGDWISQTVETETSTTPVPLFSVWSSTRGADLITVGLGGAIFRRPEGEQEFLREDTRVSQDLYGVFGSARDRVYAVGARGSILRYNGTAWSIVPAGTSADLYAVHGLADGSLIVAVGSRGAIAVLRGD